MEKNTLLLFAKRILNSSSKIKAILSLRQLEALLKEQGAPNEYIELIDDIIQDTSIVNKMLQNDTKDADKAIAEIREKARIAREKNIYDFGRC